MPPSLYASSSPVLASQSTIRPSPRTVGPSGKPRPEASRLVCIARSPFGVSVPRSVLSGSGEPVVLEVKVGQRLANPGSRVTRDLGAVRVEGVDEGRDDVSALVEVDQLHLVLDLLAGGRVGGGVRLV